MSDIAQAGGLIGVGYWDAAVCGTSIKNITESIRYGINLVGINHIALGSDFDGTINSPIDVAELYKLTDRLLKEDFTPEEIRKVMGENLIRFLKEQLPLK
jgi:microsomal dipeptidase-like Zn-dependent dipeptidase